MKIEELVVLLPCHSLEDFPVHHEGDEAEGLLAAWSGLWHPALIAACNKEPLWFRADAPPENPRARLIVIPQVCDSLLLTGWPTRAKAEGAKLIRKTPKRADIITAALAALDEPPPAVDPELVADFLALGTGYLMVELLTRQMRYMSNLDEVRFNNELVAGAKAAVEGRTDDARQNIKNAFETLYEARERFYPVDNYLIDLTLVADTTLGKSLRRELDGDVPFNLLLSGKLLERLATTAPDSLAALKHAIDRRSATVVGGEFDERETPLLPPETMLREFARGAEAYRRHLGATPTVFGRRRQGLSPLLPSILSRFGFEGALGFTLDDGAFPTVDQAKVRWEGFNAAAVDCLARVPLDAAKPESFLDLPRRLGESMDRDMVATVTFAHWPGLACPYYDDLRRIASYAPVLGKFITLADYFQNTEKPGQISKFTSDKYRTTYLRQAIVRNLSDPVSWIADVQRVRLQAEAAATLEVMCEARCLQRCSTGASALLAKIDDAAALGMSAEARNVLVDEATKLVAASSQALADSLAAESPTHERGLLVLNTSTTPRKEWLDVSTLDAPPALDGTVTAVQENDGRRHALVQVAGLGYAWLRPGPPTSKPRKPPKPMVADSVLKTGLCEVHISRKTGGIQGVFGGEVRGNRLSQQLVFRLPGDQRKPGDAWRDPDAEPLYSTMVCDAIDTTIVGPSFGEITTRGKLLDLDAKPVARYVQKVRAAAGLPLITVEVDLDVTETPRADPWGSYYAARFAWADESTALARGVFLTHQPTESKRPESPSFIELYNETSETLILSDGLPYHLQTGFRMLDTLLISRGETRRKFRFGILLDAQHPAQDALAFMSPLVTLNGAVQPTSGETGRVLLVDAKNVVATHWESLFDEDRVVGFRVRLQETEAQGGRFELHAPRKVLSARQIDARGETLVDIPAGDDRVSFEIGNYEWIEIEGKY